MAETANEHDSDAVFSECPDCGGRLEHQTRESTMCLECETVFSHEVRTGGRHYLWRSQDDLAAKEAV